MTPEELRLECLKLVLQSANASGLSLETTQLISRARAYADFVMSRGGQGGVETSNGAPAAEKNLGEGLRRPPAVSQFEAGSDDGRPRGAD